MLPVVLTAVDRLLGLLAQAAGRPDDAAGHFDDALGFCRRAGYRPEYSWSASDYADFLLERGGRGDSRLARNVWAVEAVRSEPFSGSERPDSLLNREKTGNFFKNSLIGPRICR